ncbi:MAG: hypothetical protein K2L37_01745, partial [Lactobacillus sp.]|nr:hypothetical protein [Lactobacillus sp.]
VDRNIMSSQHKVVYKESVVEGGFDTMNRDDIKAMRLDVYEDAAAGKITDNLKNYLLTYLEYVDLQLEKGEVFTEAVSGIIEQKRSDFIDFIDKSFNEGAIDRYQRDIMLEMSGEDFMFDVPTPDMIPDLVAQYLEAAKEGDDATKEQIKEKLDTAKDLEKIADEEQGNEDEVTESACETLKQKLSELKVDLTDEEKDLVDKLDDKIKKAKNGNCNKEDTDYDDDSDEEPDEEEEEETDEEPPKKKGGKEEAPEEEEKEVKESVNSFNKSGLTRKEKKEMLSYVQEAADDGIYSEEELKRIVRMLQ